jgi:GLPGLI family protein
MITKLFQSTGMMKKAILTAALLPALLATKAQNFIDKGRIEYEVKSNVHKRIAGNDLAKELPQFSVAYYDLTFAGDRSVFRFSRSGNRTRIPGWFNVHSEEDVWYQDQAKGNGVNRKEIGGENYVMKDSLVKIDWRITNETREIAGFKCRKAIGKIFDSVYVFAFYSDEITASTGPMSLNGLPGMILGVTIPRMHTSWIATKVQIVDIDETTIAAPKGKEKSVTEVKNIVKDVLKTWWGGNNDAYIWKLFI